MLSNGATTWAELYRDYIDSPAARARLAEYFLYDANSLATGDIRIFTVPALVEFLNSDDNMDIIVGGTDGLLYLLHNVQAVISNDILQVAGIVGQSFTGAYKQLAGNTVDNLFARVEQELNLEHGESAAQQWVNNELTYLNRRRVQKEGLSSQDVRAGEEPASTWLREIKGRVPYVIGNDREFIFEVEDWEQDVPWDANRGVFEVFPAADRLVLKRVATFLICPPFFTSILLNRHHTTEGMTGKDLQEYANTVAVAAFDFWRDDEFDPATTAWNAAAYIQFKTDIADFVYTAKSQPHRLFVYEITEVTVAENARMMETAGNQNGITTENMHMEDKENFSYSRNT